MNKTRFFWLAIIVLVALNLVTLFRRMPPPPEGPRKIIIERLHFDKEQATAYGQLIEKHRADIRQKDEAIAAARQAIYSLLPGNDFSKKDSLIAEVGRLQTEVEQLHFAHFQDIKKLCREEQLADFAALSRDLEQLFNRPKPKPIK
jgi:hypothetical protein